MSTTAPHGGASQAAPAPVRAATASGIVQYRCSPLRSWLTEDSCARNRAAAKPGDLMLAECVGCPGVRARRDAGAETEGPRTLGAHGLVTEPPKRPPIRRRIAASVGVAIKELAEKRREATADSIGLSLEGGESARVPRNLTRRNNGVMYYERVVDGERQRFSCETRDPHIAAQVRDEYERDQGVARRPARAAARQEEETMADRTPCECGCGKPAAPYKGTGRVPRFFSRAHAIAHRAGRPAPGSTESLAPPPRAGRSRPGRAAARAAEKAHGRDLVEQLRARRAELAEELRNLRSREVIDGEIAQIDVALEQIEKAAALL